MLASVFLQRLFLQCWTLYVVNRRSIWRENPAVISGVCLGDPEQPGLTPESKLIKQKPKTTRGAQRVHISAK